MTDGPGLVFDGAQLGAESCVRVWLAALPFSLPVDRKPNAAYVRAGFGALAALHNLGS